MPAPEQHHRLKCWPAFYQAVKRGLKPFDVRKQDRNFRAGDMVELIEWDPICGVETGDRLTRTITYILPGGAFGVARGFCVLGFGVGERD